VKFRKKYTCSCCGWTGAAREPLPGEPLVLVRTAWPLLGFTDGHRIIEWLYREKRAGREIQPYYLYDRRRRRRRVLTLAQFSEIGRRIRERGLSKHPYRVHGRGYRQLERATWSNELYAAGEDVLPPRFIDNDNNVAWWKQLKPTKIPAIAKFGRGGTE
jgi:hypothetical protein